MSSSGGGGVGLGWKIFSQLVCGTQTRNSSGRIGLSSSLFTAGTSC